jgi:hypothetical protein
MLSYLRNNRFFYFVYTWLAGTVFFYRFLKVKSLVIFIGYPRSGSSTLGSILDAHKNAVFAHELNIFKYLQRGLNSKQLFFLLARNSKLFTQKGRNSSGYSGIIKGQFNGKANPCYIVGDKKAGATSKMIGEDNSLIEQLLNVYPCVKLIHIVRNPFDMIATEAYKGNNYRLEVGEKRLDEVIQLFRNKFQTVDSLMKLGTFDIFTLKHEDLIGHTNQKLSELLSWLGLENYPGYIDAACDHLFKKPHLSRNEVKWIDSQKGEVFKLISEFDFLSGYSFEE